MGVKVRVQGKEERCLIQTGSKASGKAADSLGALWSWLGAPTSNIPHWTSNISHWSSSGASMMPNALDQLATVLAAASVAPLE